MDPAVSVILPVRDGGEFLAAAVDSILRQSLCDFELLLVDDHSRDGAATALAGTDHRLRLLNSPGQGVAAAFRHGLRWVRGRYVARMDADDIAAPERLEKQLSLLEARPDLGIVGGCVEFFPKPAVGTGNRRYGDWLNSLRSPADIHRAMFIECPIPNPTAMFRRDVLEGLGGYRDTAWPEDYDLFLRADARGVRMAKPDGVLLHWREHERRLTRTDQRYSLEQFQRAKAHYLAANRLPASELLIWGAGPTGKRLCDLLAAEGVDVAAFIDVHPRRVGGHKRGRPVLGLQQEWPENAFIVVAVGARRARRRIHRHLSSRGRREGRDFLFAA